MVHGDHDDWDGDGDFDDRPFGGEPVGDGEQLGGVGPDGPFVEPLCEGRTFPREDEWLALPPPPITADFVERTLAALSPAGAPDDAALAAQPSLPANVLDAFAPPTAAADFVARTVAAVGDDRRNRWREVLAKHVAPEPAPEFVARTLAALTADRAERDGSDWPQRPALHQHDGRQKGVAAGHARGWRAAGWTVLALAAGVSVALLWPRLGTTPIEIRFAQSVPVAYAFAETPSPLPALLSDLAAANDPLALPAASPDGAWLAFGDRAGRPR